MTFRRMLVVASVISAALLLEGCVGYRYPQYYGGGYGPHSYGYGYPVQSYPAPVYQPRYGYGNNSGYGHEREHERGRGYYGNYRRHRDDDD